MSTKNEIIVFTWTCDHTRLWGHPRCRRCCRSRPRLSSCRFETKTTNRPDGHEPEQKNLFGPLKQGLFQQLSKSLKMMGPQLNIYVTWMIFAIPLVRKSQMTSLPSLQPTARSVPYLLNWQQMAIVMQSNVPSFSSG